MKLAFFQFLLWCGIVSKSKQLFTSNTHRDYVQYGGPLKQRARRDISPVGTTCTKDVLDEDAKKKIKKNQFPLKDDNNYDLQLVWLGDNAQKLFLLTTTDLNFFLFHSHAPSKLYQSEDYGFSFDNAQDKINNTEIRSSYGIMKSPLNNNKVIFISYTSTSMGLFSSIFTSRKEKNTFLIITENGGKTFLTVEIPFVVREKEPFLFHPTEENTIIALERQKKIMHIGEGKTEKYGFAWISKDFGKTWKAMMKGYVAETVKWGAAKGKEGKEIYLSTQIDSSTPFSSFFTSTSKLTLWKSSNGGDAFEEIVQECFNFGVQGDFVFASVEFKDTESKEEKRIMHVSKDSGDTFHPVHVPEITAERFYAVVEMYNGTIFLHVDESGDTGKGTLYISGADGLVYTKSLDNHFYTNSGFNDFVKIESMEGVYVTQVLAKDLTLTSAITFNRGVTWQPLYVPNDCKNSKDSCSLHFHSQYSQQKHVPMQPPLSTPSAPGIVFVHGNAGDGLVGLTSVWLSTNGGYNWTKVADGPHHYAIGDRGNLLVIIPMLNSTGNVLKYSIDQGRCWNEYKFTDSNNKVTIRGLVTEPHSQDRVFSLWGYLTDAPKNKKEWLVITINFNNMFSKQCSSEDLEEFYPHASNGKGGCILGKQIVYKRPKLDAVCYLGRSFQPFAKEKICTCTDKDIECDYGYERQSGKCARNKDIKPIEVCKNGRLEKEGFSKGYRRMPGDVCSSEQAINDLVKFIDEKKTCVTSIEDLEGIESSKKEEERIVTERKEEREREQERKAQEKLQEKQKENDENNLSVNRKKKEKKSSHTFAVIFAIMLVFGLTCTVIFFARKHIKQRQFKGSFAFSQLDEQDDEIESKDAFDPRPKTHRAFKDESDVEDDIMLPV